MRLAVDNLFIYKPICYQIEKCARMDQFRGLNWSHPEHFSPKLSLIFNFFIIYSFIWNSQKRTNRKRELKLLTEKNGRGCCAQRISYWYFCHELFFLFIFLRKASNLGPLESYDFYWEKKTNSFFFSKKKPKWWGGKRNKNEQCSSLVFVGLLVCVCVCLFVILLVQSEADELSLDPRLLENGRIFLFWLILKKYLRSFFFK